MPIILQNIIIALIVLCAGVYLARRLYRTFKGAGGCACPGSSSGGCARMEEVERNIARMVQSNKS